MDFFKNIFAHIKPEKQQKQEPPPPPTVRQTTNEKSKQERRSRQASVSVKTEPTRKASFRSDVVRRRRSRQKSIERGVERGTGLSSPNTTSTAAEGSGSGSSSSGTESSQPQRLSDEGRAAAETPIGDEGKKETKKTEPAEQKAIEGKDEEKKEKRAKHPTKRAKDLLETSTEFEVVAAPLRPAVADEDKKPKVMQLVKRSKDQEEPMTDFEAVAVPSRPAVAKGQKKSAAMRLAKDQRRLKTDSELEVECTIESPPPSDSTARETPSRSSSGEYPTATTPHD